MRAALLTGLMLAMPAALAVHPGGQCRRHNPALTFTKLFGRAVNQ